MTRRFLFVLLFTACAQAVHAQQHASDGCPSKQIVEGSLPVVDPLPFQSMADARLVLSLRYDECGDVVKATVDRSSGSKQVDAAARALALTWRMPPDRSLGRPTSGKLQLVLDFSSKPSPTHRPLAGILPPPPEGGQHLEPAIEPLAALPVPYRYFNAQVGTAVRDAPEFSPLEGLFGVGGTVVVIVDIDAAGNVANAAIERSSRNRSLDRQAMRAAKSWRFLPQISGGRAMASRARVPVDFNPYETWTVGLRDRDPARSRIPEVARQSDGTLPGYVPDPVSLGVASVAEALKMLQAEATAQRAIHGKKFLLEDGNGISKWSVCESGCPGAPVLRRWRLVNDGTHAFWASSILCGSNDQDACSEFKKLVEKGSPPQRPMKLQ
jgi:protein TonB